MVNAALHEWETHCDIQSQLIEEDCTRVFLWSYCGHKRLLQTTKIWFLLSAREIILYLWFKLNLRIKARNRNKQTFDVRAADCSTPLLIFSRVKPWQNEVTFCCFKNWFFVRHWQTHHRSLKHAVRHESLQYNATTGCRLTSTSRLSTCANLMRIESWERTRTFSYTKQRWTHFRQFMSFFPHWLEA